MSKPAVQITIETITLDGLAATRVVQYFRTPAECEAALQRVIVAVREPEKPRRKVSPRGSATNPKPAPAPQED